MKKILITGVAGFIGSNLAEHLLDEGDSVFGLDNFITGSPKNINKLAARDNFTFLQADVASLDSGQKLAIEREGFDEVYHLACPTGVPNLVPLAREMLLASSAGTQNILDIALKARAKFLFTSSSEVYGDPQVYPQKEEYTGNVDPTGIRSPYEEGKRFAESLIVMYCRRCRLDGKIARVFNTYGPNMSEKDQRVIPKFFNQLSNSSPLTIHGDGTQKRTFCHASDLVQGLVLTMRKGESGQVYNIGGAEEVTIADIAKLMLKLAGRDVGIKHEDRPAHDHQSRRPDLGKITSLGWSPKIRLEEGLAQLFNELEPQKVG